MISFAARMLAMGFVTTLLVGCEKDAPTRTRDPWNPPQARVIHINPSTSPDGRHLAYIEEAPGVGILHVLDLTNGSDRIIEIGHLLPTNTITSPLSYVLWCPYDPSRLLTHCVMMSTDSSVAPPQARYGHNLYVISIDRDSLWRVTPSRFGPFGAGNGFYVNSWLRQSTPARDMFYVSDGTAYIPQTDSSVPIELDNLLDQSQDGHHTLSTRLHVGTMFYVDILLDGLPLTTVESSFPLKPYTVRSGAFSPSGNHMAIIIDDGKTSPQLWVLKLDKYWRNHGTAIPAVRLLSSLPSHLELWPAVDFLTDFTLVVPISDEQDNEVRRVLWEIALDGRMIRQLTFAP